MRNRVLATVCLTLVLAFLQPARATAKPGEPVQELQMTGVCPWLEGESKVVTTVLRGDRLLAPYFLMNDKGAWTGAVLLPYEVTASGEGLKSRHLLPGTYTRSGPAPADAVSCSFTGTAVDGEVVLDVVGSVILTRILRPRR